MPQVNTIQSMIGITENILTFKNANIVPAMSNTVTMLHIIDTALRYIASTDNGVVILMYTVTDTSSKNKNKLYAVQK